MIISIYVGAAQGAEWALNNQTYVHMNSWFHYAKLYAALAGCISPLLSFTSIHFYLFDIKLIPLQKPRIRAVTAGTYLPVLHGGTSCTGNVTE